MQRFFAYLDTSDWAVLGMCAVNLLCLVIAAIDHYRMTEREKREREKGLLMDRLRRSAMNKVNDDIDRQRRKAVQRANHAYHNDSPWWT